jgi:hypothetical protein
LDVVVTQAARARKMKQLQKLIEEMHPLALELVSDEYSVAERRKFLEGVSFWMMFELSDALNKLCADDRKKLGHKATKPSRKATTKITKGKPRRITKH